MVIFDFSVMQMKKHSFDVTTAAVAAAAALVVTDANTKSYIVPYLCIVCIVGFHKICY